MSKAAVALASFALALAVAPALAVPISGAPRSENSFRAFTQQTINSLGAFSAFWSARTRLGPVVDQVSCAACGPGPGFVQAISTVPVLPLPPTSESPAPEIDEPTPQAIPDQVLPTIAVPPLVSEVPEVPPNAVPEPDALALTGLGLAALGASSRRRRTSH